MFAPVGAGAPPPAGTRRQLPPQASAPTWAPFLALLAGCAVAEAWEPSDAFVVTYDRGCVQPTELDREIFHRAAWLWLEWNVQASEDLDEGQPLTVCLQNGPLSEGRAGMSYGPENGWAAIVIDRTLPERLYSGTIAHEIGHLMLRAGSYEHLPAGQSGIMAAALDCPAGGPSELCAWSAADVAHLESFGLSREGDLL